MNRRDDQASCAELYDEAPCGLLTTAQDGLIERANRTFCRWVGRAPEDLQGRMRFQDLLTVGGRIFHQTHLAPLLRMQGSISEVKLDLRTAEGVTVPIMVNGVRTERDGVVADALAVFVAKERHAYERELMLSRRHAEELAESQKRIQHELRDADRRKDEFLAMLAHELRNPLAPIASSAQVLRLAADDAERVRGVADIITRQITHLTEIVDDLLDVSRVTRGLIELERVPLEMAGVVAAAVEQARPLTDARGHIVEVDLRADATVQADRTRLVQVVTNLLNNAAKYTPQGGRIVVTVDCWDGQVQVDVVDNGIGIDAALLPHVFDLFSQAERTPDRAQGGLGIGLALVRSLVALHGGSIEAHSEGLHRGSRFTVRLPALAPVTPQVVDVRKAPDTMHATASARVLVVDDNHDAALMLADVLRFAGHVVDIATSGHDALDRVCTAAEGFDVCILDIGLPDISGYELASRIRAQAPAQSVLLVALTGYGQPHDVVLAKAAGFDHHCVKPADPDALLGLIQQAVATRGSAAVAH